MTAPERRRELHLTWHSVSRPDAIIHYLDSGDAGPPVVLLHGLAGHAGEWHCTIRHLFPRWRTLALDQRGHGRSTRMPGDLSRNAFADDVAAVIGDAGVDCPMMLIGQSMGAHTAFVTAARFSHLVSHLVMIEGDIGGGGGDKMAALRDAMTSWPVPFPDYDSAVNFFGGDNDLGHAWADGFEQHGEGLWPRWHIDVMMRTMELIFASEYWSEWNSLPQPTLVVLEDTGSIHPGQVERMIVARPTTRLVRIAGAGHDVHLEQPRAWLHVLDEFLT